MCVIIVAGYVNINYNRKVFPICCEYFNLYHKPKLPARLSVYKFKLLANLPQKKLHNALIKLYCMFQLALYCLYLVRVEWPLSVCLMMLLSIILDCCSASTFRGFLATPESMQQTFATDCCLLFLVAWHCN